MSRWKWETTHDDLLDQEEWQEMEEEAYREEENHCKQLESDFKLDFYPEEDTL